MRGIHRWPVDSTKASNSELRCFLWSAPEQTVVQTIETPVIWDALELVMKSLYCSPRAQNDTVRVFLWAECHRTLLMVSQHWFWLWLGAIRQKAITWTKVDPDLFRHMASRGHNELKVLELMIDHDDMIETRVYTETVMSSVWLRFLHRRLPVQPVIKMSSKGRHLRCNEFVIRAAFAEGQVPLSRISAGSIITNYKWPIYAEGLIYMKALFFKINVHHL